MNTNVPVGSPEGGVFGAESSTDYEIGFKSDWRLAGMPLRLNAALYRVEIDDVQVSAQAVLPLPGGGTMNSVIVANAAEAHTEGFEIETLVEPVEGLTLHATYEGFSAAYDRVTAPPSFAAGALLSQTFNVAPHTLSIGARYQIPVPLYVGDLSLSVNYRWVDDQIVSTTPAVPNAIIFEPDYDVIDLRLDWRAIGGGAMDFAVYVHNLNDTLYRTGMSNSAAPFGVATSYYGDPFLAGIELRYNFGR